jgi:hypothetical protein
MLVAPFVRVVTIPLMVALACSSCAIALEYTATGFVTERFLPHLQRISMIAERGTVSRIRHRLPL